MGCSSYLKRFVKNVELSNAIIFGIKITSFYTCINQSCNKKVLPAIKLQKKNAIEAV